MPATSAGMMHKNLLRVGRACGGEIDLGDRVAAVTAEARGDDRHVHLLQILRQRRLEICRIDRALQRGVNLLVDVVFRKVRVRTVTGLPALRA